MQISRRNLIKGVGAGALGLGVGMSLNQKIALAQTSPAEQQVSAFYRYKVGDFNMTAIKDAAFSLTPETFAQNGDPEEIAAVIERYNLPEGNLPMVADVTLVQTGDRTVLLDTGTGNGLLPTLEALGVAPEDVTDVIITHFHGDHISGASFEGALAYPNAQYHISQVEFDFLQGAMGDDAPDAITGAMAKLQPAIDGDQLMMYSDEDEIVPGIQALAAPGHTAGHHAILVASGGAQLLNIVDSALNAYLSLANPNWFAGFDSDGEMAAETRMALLNRAADEQLQVFGYHFPFPGIGYVSRREDGFAFTPTG